MISVFQHFRKYWFNYITVFGVPILYNKITYHYGWTELPIFSMKFVNLYFLTFLLQLLISFLAAAIQKFGMQQVGSQNIVWKSVWYRIFFYSAPVGLGLCVLIIFKFLWYEGEDLYPILMAHAKSRFLIYLIAFVLFTIWLDRDPNRNLYIAYLFNGFPGHAIAGHDIHVTADNESDKFEESVGLAVERISSAIENTITSVLKQNVIRLDVNEVKDIMIQAIQEYVDSNQLTAKDAKESDNMVHILKVMLNDKIKEFFDSNPLLLKNEVGQIAVLPVQQYEMDTLDDRKGKLETLKDVQIEKLYGKLYNISQTQLDPSYNDRGDVKFFHFFAIETHAKYAVVILTDGTQIRSEKILDVLEKMGLLKWMVKVNKCHFINAMHICFMNYLDGNFVRIQDLTLKSLETNLKKIEVTKICGLGIKIKDSNIKAFLESRSELRNEDWNTFVPLKK